MANNISVAKLMELLAQFPPDALIAAYEGEVQGVRIDAPGRPGSEIGFIDETTGEVKHG